MAPVDQILCCTGLSTNGDVSLPFRKMVACKEPVFLVPAGYSNGGKSYSLLGPNPEDPPTLEVLLLHAFEIHNMLQKQLPTMLGKNLIARIFELLSTPLEVAKFVLLHQVVIHGMLQLVTYKKKKIIACNASLCKAFAQQLPQLK